MDAPAEQSRKDMTLPFWEPRQPGTPNGFVERAQTTSLVWDKGRSEEGNPFPLNQKEYTSDKL